jgi:DNA repair protein RecN (Recombination protein N)
MLSLIRVRNYAVIDEVEVELAPGLSVLTGETGAGKSILVDALGLALGDRADASTVRPGADRAEISVLFECGEDHPSISWLREHGLDEDLCCLIRRVISAEGRSRAFINSHPVTLQDLRTLGALLVDIHGQHAHQSLLQRSAQRQILDFHGSHGGLVQSVAAAFEAWQALETELRDSRQGGADRRAQLELLQFQVAELETLGLAEGELEPLSAERSRLANVDRLASALNTVLAALYEGEPTSAYTLVAAATKELSGAADLDAELSGPASMLAETEIQVREAASELARYRDRLEPDPQRLEWVEARLGRISDLARRHGVEEAALAGLRDQLEDRIDALQMRTDSLDALSGRCQSAAEAYLQAASQLSDARAASAQTLAEEVSAQLKELGLTHARFRVHLERKPKERADSHGLDQVEFQVTLNPGQEFGPLARVASGGELSRISLALEVLTTGASTVPTLIFDEVDAGIGGSVAEIVGRRLGQIANDSQVLCVTHLPQVASQGQHHYRVAKLTDGKTSRTNVRLLSAAERVEELSRMLGGLEITERVRAHAEEMIGRAAR